MVSQLDEGIESSLAPPPSDSVTSVVRTQIYNQLAQTATASSDASSTIRPAVVYPLILRPSTW